jgi:hypothetical protein
VATSTAAIAGMGDRVGGEIHEQTDDGKVTWGRSPPGTAPRVLVDWHPGYGPERRPAHGPLHRRGPGTTRVELEHRGWEVHRDSGEEAFRGYTSGWDPVLATYVERRRLTRLSPIRSAAGARGGVRARGRSSAASASFHTRLQPQHQAKRLVAGDQVSLAHDQDRAPSSAIPAGRRP